MYNKNTMELTVRSKCKGQNYAVVKREFDERGNKISEVYFTQSGSRGTDNFKVHKYYNQYDKVVNKMCHQISFGVDGKPVAADNVAAEGRITYDKRGNMTKLVCYDGYGRKVNGLRGWCEERFTYNEAGDETSEAFFDINGKAVTNTYNKYHKAVYTYNNMRMVSSVSYYGSNGKPTEIVGGYSSVKYKYNQQNQRTETAYFGTGGGPVDNSNGWHREVYTFKAGKNTDVCSMTRTTVNLHQRSMLTDSGICKVRDVRMRVVTITGR